jgi:hypothetical protein
MNVQYILCKMKEDVGTTRNKSSASQSQASNQPMLGNGGMKIISSQRLLAHSDQALSTLQVQFTEAVK